MVKGSKAMGLASGSKEEISNCTKTRIRIVRNTYGNRNTNWNINRNLNKKDSPAIAGHFCVANPITYS